MLAFKSMLFSGAIGREPNKEEMRSIFEKGSEGREEEVLLNLLKVKK